MFITYIDSGRTREGTPRVVDKGKGNRCGTFNKCSAHPCSSQFLIKKTLNACSGSGGVRVWKVLFIIDVLFLFYFPSCQSISRSASQRGCWPGPPHHFLGYHVSGQDVLVERQGFAVDIGSSNPGIHANLYLYIFGQAIGCLFFFLFLCFERMRDVNLSGHRPKEKDGHSRMTCVRLVHECICYGYAYDYQSVFM